MKKIELLIPTGQYANIKFIVEYQTEEELDLEISRLWARYFGYFDKQAQGKGE